LVSTRTLGLENRGLPIDVGLIFSKQPSLIYSIFLKTIPIHIFPLKILTYNHIFHNNVINLKCKGWMALLVASVSTAAQMLTTGDHLVIIKNKCIPNMINSNDFTTH
jgi:hypothetical protein